MPASNTELTLNSWRYGQAQAERLVAAILHLENYNDVDPQHPLGGPDGLKDVVCRKGKKRWIAAAYFPPTGASFKEISTKFSADAVGVAANGAKGFAFFVNQRVTVSEREKLISASPAQETEIYHLERLVSLLDSPKGCGLRLEYLRIPMTESEQWAFWSTMNAHTVRKLLQNESRRDSKINKMDRKLDMLLRQTRIIQTDLAGLPSSLAVPGPTGATIADALVSPPSTLAEGASFHVFPPLGTANPEHPTAALSLSMLCWLHRVLTEGLRLPEAVRGRLRSVQVWVGRGDGAQEDDAHHPPPPVEVVHLTEDLLRWWRGRHGGLRTADRSTIVAALAEFHHRLLAIHPFVDANGRVARAVLDQAARELLDLGVGTGFTADPGDYYRALAAADAGDLGPLRKRLNAALQ